MPKQTKNRLRSRLRRNSRQVAFILSNFSEDPRWYRQSDWTCDIDWFFVKCGIISYPILGGSRWTEADRRKAKIIKWLQMFAVLQATIRWTSCMFLPADPHPWDYYLGNVAQNLGG